MQPNTVLLVTDRGSLVLPGGRMVKPGERFQARAFQGREERLAALVAEGNVTTDLDRPVSQLDLRMDALKESAPLPHEIVVGKADAPAGPTADEARIRSELRELGEKREARQAALAEMQDQELTPEEAKALGILNS